MRVFHSRIDNPAVRDSAARKQRCHLPPTNRSILSSAVLRPSVRGAEFLAGVFNALSCDVIALDGDGRVVALSDSAEQIIRHGTLLRRSRTTLIAAEPIRRKFEAAVRRCSATTHDVNEPIVITVSGARHQISALRIAPLSRSSHHFGCAAIVILDRTSSPPEKVLLPELLARFTPAETTIAHALLRGQSPSEIARRRDVSIATVRSQIKSVYAKAGVTNRGEFTGKALAGA
jgi:DNA-binding CsgD family transcriptional regulator